MRNSAENFIAAAAFFPVNNFVLHKFLYRCLRARFIEMEIQFFSSFNICCFSMGWFERNVKRFSRKYLTFMFASGLFAAVSYQVQQPTSVSPCISPSSFEATTRAYENLKHAFFASRQFFAGFMEQNCRALDRDGEKNENYAFRSVQQNSRSNKLRSELKEFINWIQEKRRAAEIFACREWRGTRWKREVHYSTNRFSVQRQLSLKPFYSPFVAL